MAGLLALVGAAGCGSLSDSSTSISKSVSTIVSSPSESLSCSSSPQDAHRDDVRDFTAAYLKSGGDATNLKREVSEFAQKHGVSDWENDQTTFKGIGVGIAKAGLRQAELDGYKSGIAGDEQQMVDAEQDVLDVPFDENQVHAVRRGLGSVPAPNRIK